MRTALFFAKKDFSFFRQWFIAGLLMPLAVVVVTIIDKELLFLSPTITIIFAIFCGTEFLISRVNQEEWDVFTKEFLEALPVTHFDQILGRYITAFIMVCIISIMSGWSVNLIAGCGYSPMLIAAGIVLVYFSLELWLYYKFGFEITKYTFLVAAALIFGGYKICGIMGLNIDESSLSEIPEWAFLLIGIAAFVQSFALSVKMWRKK